MVSDTGQYEGGQFAVGRGSGQGAVGSGQGAGGSGQGAVGSKKCTSLSLIQTNMRMDY